MSVTLAGETETNSQEPTHPPGRGKQKRLLEIHDFSQAGAGHQAPGSRGEKKNIGGK